MGDYNNRRMIGMHVVWRWRRSKPDTLYLSRILTLEEEIEIIMADIKGVGRPT